MARDPSLLDPFDHLISLRIENRPLEVPASNTVLRLLQYLDFDLYACRLCWNSDCDNCRFRYLDPDTGAEVEARGCETQAFDGMCITRIPDQARWPPDEP